MKSSLTSTTARTVLINFGAAILFLAVSSHFWAPKELADIPGAGAGDPIIWGLTIFPMLVIIALVNIAWLTANCVWFLKTKHWNFTAYYLLVPLMWAIALYIGYSHHWAL